MQHSSSCAEQKTLTEPAPSQDLLHSSETSLNQCWQDTSCSPVWLESLGVHEPVKRKHCWLVLTGCCKWPHNKKWGLNIHHQMLDPFLFLPISTQTAWDVNVPMQSPKMSNVFVNWPIKGLEMAICFGCIFLITDWIQKFSCVFGTSNNQNASRWHHFSVCLSSDH